MNGIMLHCDMNNYFASVECVYNPRLKSVPMAVCGDPKTRHGIILAKNYLAKNRGVMTGESIFSAKAKVPELSLVNANYQRYLEFSKKTRAIFGEYGDEIVPYGLDEAWLNVSNRAGNVNDAARIANEIRARIRSELHLTASVGVSFNYIFSKLASDMKKPDATTVISRDELESVIWNLPAFELLFVGASTRKKLRNLGILTIGDLARADPLMLKKNLGKPGLNLWQFANGNDSSFDPKVPEDEPFKSFGNTVTLTRDLSEPTDILSILLVITKTVCARLKKHGIKSRCVGMNLKYSDFTTVGRQTTLPDYTDSEVTVFKSVKALFDKNYNSALPVRALGVHVTGFTSTKFTQLSMFDGESQSSGEMNEIIANLKNKIGDFRLDRSATANDLEIDLKDIM